MVLQAWDLVSPVEYSAGEELTFDLHFEAPADTEAEKFYILGGLYTSDGTYISGSLFGILKAAEVDYGVNSATYLSLWELEPEEEVNLPCRLILGRTNCLLALFLMKMVGDEPSIDADEQIAEIQAELTAPRTAWEEMQDIISQNIVPITTGVIVLGMVGMMSYGMFKR